MLELCDHGDLIKALDQGVFHAPEPPMGRGSQIIPLAVGPKGSLHLNMPALLLTLVEVASALSHLHSLGIVHCDIKVAQTAAALGLLERGY